MRMSGPSAPCLISSDQCQLAPSPRGSDVWALLMLGLSSTLSINGVSCSHAVYSSTDSMLISSVVAQPARILLTWNRRNTLGDRPQYASSGSLAPPAPLFHRLLQRRIRYVVGPLPTPVPLNSVVVLPARHHPTRSEPVVIVLLATSLRDRNTFKQLMSESCCVVESL